MFFLARGLADDGKRYRSSAEIAERFIPIAVALKGEEGVCGRRGGFAIFRGRRVGGFRSLKDVSSKTATSDPASDQLLELF